MAVWLSLSLSLDAFAFTFHKHFSSNIKSLKKYQRALSLRDHLVCPSFLFSVCRLSMALMYELCTKTLLAHKQHQQQNETATTALVAKIDKTVQQLF